MRTRLGDGAASACNQLLARLASGLGCGAGCWLLCCPALPAPSLPPVSCRFHGRWKPPMLGLWRKWHNALAQEDLFLTHACRTLQARCALS